MFCFFSFVLTFCFVDVRHAHASRPSRSWIFFLYIIFISRHRSEQKKEERRTRFLFYLMADVFEPLHILYVKHVHMHTRDKTINRCFVTSFLHQFYTRWWMFMKERESKCTVDFDFWSRLTYVCHHNLSFAYYHDITTL
jgi:hypothetical protein